MSKAIPGPPAAGFYVNPGSFIADRLGSLQGLAAQYGDCCKFRLGVFDIYLLNHPDYVKQILLTDAGKVEKSMLLKVARILLGNGLLTSEGSFHKRQRRLMAPAFHKQRIQHYAACMVRHSREMAGTWQDGQRVDLHQEMNRLTLGIIGETMFGADVRNEAAAVNRCLQIIFPMLNRFADARQWILAVLPLPDNFRFWWARYTLNRIVYGLIRAERDATAPREDLLSMLLEARDEEGDGTGMNDRQVRDEILITFLAGHETTANALSWTWYLLSQHPDAAARLHDELDSVLDGRAPVMEDIPRLVYTRQVVSEAIRLYPPAYAMDRYTVDDIELDGYRIPKGKTIFVSPYLLHHDARFYPDPERFDPDRWTAEAVAARPRFTYIPFGAGPRVCIGEQFAWTEAILVLATLAQQWEAALDPAARVEAFPLITLRPRYGLPMTLHRRGPSE